MSVSGAVVRELAVLGSTGTIGEQTLAVAAYFTGKVLLLSPSDLSVSKTVTLPNNPAEDQIRT